MSVWGGRQRTQEGRILPALLQGRRSLFLACLVLFMLSLPGVVLTSAMQAAGGALPPGWRTVFDTDLTGAGTRAWPVGKVGAARAQVVKGYYTLSTDSGHTAIVPPKQHLLVGDGQITATFKVIGTGQVGLAARWTGTDNHWRLYAFWISSSGEFGLWRWSPGGPNTYTSLFSLRSEDIKRQGENTVTLRVQGNDLHWSINGHEGSYTAKPLLPPGAWGLYINSGATHGAVEGQFTHIALVGVVATLPTATRTVTRTVTRTATRTATQIPAPPTHTHIPTASPALPTRTPVPTRTHVPTATKPSPTATPRPLASASPTAPTAATAAPAPTAYPASFDLTGSWSGVLSPTSASGGSNEMVVLSQNGSSVSGTETESITIGGTPFHGVYQWQGTINGAAVTLAATPIKLDPLPQGTWCASASLVLAYTASTGFTGGAHLAGDYTCQSGAGNSLAQPIYLQKQ